MSHPLKMDLASVGIDLDELQRLVSVALAEDLRYGPDITSEATLRPDQTATADVAARESGVVSGVPVALVVLESVGFDLAGATIHVHDGQTVAPGDVVMTMSGSLRQLLLAERTMLNFMTHLSGVASATRRWVSSVEGTGCQVRDTRKTTPGLRQLEKYAVRCGGGVNHRMGLGDAALIKDNHIAATGSITQAVNDVRRANPDVVIEVECDTIDQVREALAAQCSLLLLDNMSLEEIGAAAALARDTPGVRLEASGGITLANVVEVAQTGVDYVAIGALTHSAIALDLGLDVRE